MDWDFYGGGDWDVDEQTDPDGRPYARIHAYGDRNLVEPGRFRVEQVLEMAQDLLRLWASMRERENTGGDDRP